MTNRFMGLSQSLRKWHIRAPAQYSKAARKKMLPRAWAALWVEDAGV